MIARRQPVRVVQAAGCDVHLVQRSVVGKVSWVPQVEQKERMAWELERNRAGSPAMMRKSTAGTVNQATQGAPVVPLHMSQWQLVWLLASSDASYRIAPQ